MSQIEQDTAFLVVPTPVPPVPSSAMALAALGLLGSVIEGLRRTEIDTDNPGLPVSILLSAAVVAWVSHGVLKGRGFRLGLATVVLVLLALGELLGVAFGPGRLWSLLDLSVTLAMLAALAHLVRSPFHAWQRQHHDLSRSAVGGVLLLAALSGAVGGFVGNPPDEPRARFHYEIRV